MAWQIIKKFNLDGEEVKIWQGRDAEGRRIFSVASESDLYEPTGGLYSQKAAKEEYLEGKKLLQNLE